MGLLEKVEGILEEPSIIRIASWTMDYTPEDEKDLQEVYFQIAPAEPVYEITEESVKKLSEFQAHLFKEFQPLEDAFGEKAKSYAPDLAIGFNLRHGFDAGYFYVREKIGWLRINTNYSMYVAKRFRRDALAKLCPVPEMCNKDLHRRITVLIAPSADFQQTYWALTDAQSKVRWEGQVHERAKGQLSAMGHLGGGGCRRLTIDTKCYNRYYEARG